MKNALEEFENVMEVSVGEPTLACTVTTTFFFLIFVLLLLLLILLLQLQKLLLRADRGSDRMQ